MPSLCMPSLCMPPWYFNSCCVSLCSVNTNLDMVVSAIDLLKALKLQSTAPQDHSALSSLVELEQLVAFSMYHCAGVERIFTNQTLFNSITTVAASLPHVVSED